jgi:hypothetical protein
MLKWEMIEIRLSLFPHHVNVSILMLEARLIWAPAERGAWAMSDVRERAVAIRMSGVKPRRRAVYVLRDR